MANFNWEVSSMANWHGNEKSPSYAGNTSSFMVHFPLPMLILSGVHPLPVIYGMLRFHTISNNPKIWEHFPANRVDGLIELSFHPQHIPKERTTKKTPDSPHSQVYDYHIDLLGWCLKKVLNIDDRTQRKTQTQKKTRGSLHWVQYTIPFPGYVRKCLGYLHDMFLPWKKTRRAT